MTSIGSSIQTVSPSSSLSSSVFVDGTSLPATVAGGIPAGFASAPSEYRVPPKTTTVTITRTSTAHRHKGAPPSSTITDGLHLDDMTTRPVETGLSLQLETQIGADSDRPLQELPSATRTTQQESSSALPFVGDSGEGDGRLNSKESGVAAASILGIVTVLAVGVFCICRLNPQSKYYRECLKRNHRPRPVDGESKPSNSSTTLAAAESDKRVWA